ncbi:MAG: threonine--tRNA ligase, partial [Deltaproteobacteria bacterium]|nr:threonine--tRNA ligase [Deltaproteobacteria bacterium]
MVKVKFPDGGEKDFAEGVSFFEVLKEHDRAALKKSCAVRVNGVLNDLGAKLDSGATVIVEPVGLDTKEGLEICRHSASHIMAEAVKSLFKNVKVAIGPAIEDGFYYDFDTERPFTPEDLEKIEARMREIIKADLPFKRMTMTRVEALMFFKLSGEDYKVEIINELPDERVSLYTQGDFVDLCRGPHLPSTGYVKAFKLTGAAGAYWRGSEKNKMLQRIYGKAFPSKKELDEHLARLEEAKKRDHRKLGRELDLFSTSEEIGAGLVLWHPKGATVRRVIEDFWKGEHVKSGYDIVYTPHIALVDLWKKSGHWDFYRESLFSPMDVEGQDYIVKPMNC